MTRLFTARSGDYMACKMSRAFVSVEEEGRGVVLACRIFPKGDLCLEAVDTLARCVERSHRRDLPGVDEKGRP